MKKLYKYIRLLFLAISLGIIFIPFCYSCTSVVTMSNGVQGTAVIENYYSSFFILKNSFINFTPVSIIIYLCFICYFAFIALNIISIKHQINSVLMSILNLSLVQFIVYIIFFIAHAQGGYLVSSILQIIFYAGTIGFNFYSYYIER